MQAELAPTQSAKNDILMNMAIPGFRAQTPFLELEGVRGNPRILRAYYLAKFFHRNTKRQSGEPYFTHPESCARLIVECTDVGNLNTRQQKQLTRQVIAALLHDVVEEKKTQLGRSIRYFAIRWTLGKLSYRDVRFLTDRPDLSREKRRYQQVIRLHRQSQKSIKRYGTVAVVRHADKWHNFRNQRHRSPEEQGAYLEFGRAACEVARAHTLALLPKLVSYFDQQYEHERAHLLMEHGYDSRQNIPREIKLARRRLRLSLE